VELEEILGVLQGWMGREVEVSAHGAEGAPVTALDVRGRLRAGDALGRGERERFLFVLDDQEGRQVGSFSLQADVLRGGGWFDRGGEVLKIRTGVILLLLGALPAEEGSERSG
jgi:hypothetical protein